MKWGGENVNLHRLDLIILQNRANLALIFEENRSKLPLLFITCILRYARCCKKSANQINI